MNGVTTLNKMAALISTDQPVIHQRQYDEFWEIFAQGNLLYVYTNITGNVDPLPTWVVMA